ncbi:MAG TPA: cysteine desulfurase family protein [Eubacteriales bacterium]|nr:cysteine desulfurase family protein [Clostridia bacterium]HRV72490.1 cysteine desulfurase family protein [Eubacteriales bacterium]
MIYLDNSATTKVGQAAAQASTMAMTDMYYNPASGYNAAVQTEKRVEQARQVMARAIGCDSSEIVFTSGGTESNNAAVFGTLIKTRGKVRIITTAAEHPSIFEQFRYLERIERFDVKYTPVKQDGSVNLEALEEMLTEDTALVSCMHVNNEVGAVFDLRSVRELMSKRSPNAVLHSDGVQAFLKLEEKTPDVDLYSVSGHKFHAPKGVGFLYVKSGTNFGGGQMGGGQERNLRSGTTNVPGILGMEQAVIDYTQDMTQKHDYMRRLKQRLYSNLRSLPDVLLNGPSLAEAAPHILNLSFLGVRAEVLMHSMDERGVCLATGSACSTHKKGKNRILTAMGIVGPRQEGAIRISLSPLNTEDEMDLTAQILFEQVQFLRRYRRR